MIQVLVKPNSKKNQIAGVDERGLHIKLKEKPQDGKANKALLVFLADVFNIPKKEVKLLRGEKYRIKQISIPYSHEAKALLETLNQSKAKENKQ